MTPTGANNSQGKPRKRFKARLKSSPLYQSAKGSRWYWRIKLFLKRRAGRELKLQKDIRIRTRESDQWVYAPDALPAGSILYCFGIGDSITFERALMEEQVISVHAFDPTPAALSWIQDQQTPAGFEFHPWAVAG
ncbi:MAG: hypothetical protein GWN29_13040, partial [Gammaproteobacteria bacterium]|nr:hypothetical protein [Gammaproteobacteria bacterium]